MNFREKNQMSTFYLRVVTIQPFPFIPPPPDRPWIFGHPAVHTWLMVFWPFDAPPLLCFGKENECTRFSGRVTLSGNDILLTHGDRDTSCTRPDTETSSFAHYCSVGWSQFTRWPKRQQHVCPSPPLFTHSLAVVSRNSVAMVTIKIYSTLSSPSS